MVAQAMNVFILPVVSRIYTPADFGVMAAYSSVIAVLSEISGLRYHNAIPLPKNEIYSRSLVTLSFIIQCIIVILISFILFFAGDTILNILALEILCQYKIFIPIGIAGIGIYNILLKMSIRRCNFKTIGKTKISQSLGRNITIILLGVITRGPLGLIIGTIIGQSGGILTLFKDLLPLQNFSCTSLSMIRRAAIRYRRFPLYNTFFGVVNTFGLYLPQLALTAFYGASVTGIYAMASLLLSLPPRFIGEAIGNVFVQRASSAWHTGNLQNLAMRFYIVMLKLSIFPVAALSLAAPLLLGIILGTQWSESGLYALALVPFVGYNLVYSPLNVLYLVCDRQKKALHHEAFSVLCKMVIFYCGGKAYISPIHTVAVFSVCCFFISLFRVSYLLGVVGISQSCVLVHTFRTIAYSCILLVIPCLCYIFNFNILCILTITLVLIPYSYKTIKELKTLSIL